MKRLSNLNAAVGLGRRGLNVLRLASNVADAETITIGGEVYEIDTAAAPGTYTAGNYRVDCNAGVTPSVAAPAIVAAINANTKLKLTAVKISDNEILVYVNDESGPGGALACTETLAGANNAWMSATMVGGAAGPVGFQIQSRAAVAQEATIGNMHFVFPFTVGVCMAVVRTSAGVAKAWDGVLSKSGGRVTLDNSGTSDWAATDVVTVVAGT